MSRLFTPLHLGTMPLQHRIAMAPLSRFRASDNHTPTALMEEYYDQRARIPGTLLISEANMISPSQGGYANSPGLYNATQIAAWKRITDKVHARGSFIVAQIIAVGRSAQPAVAAREGITVKGASAIPQSEEYAVPVPLTVEEIQGVVGDFGSAARNAIAAGFDAVEIHGANGYLVDQFLQESANARDDEYGGDVERRARFAVEVVRAVVEAVGAERTAVRLSPWNRVAGMGTGDQRAQFGYVVREINALGKLAYLHLTEAVGGEDQGEDLDFAVDAWDGPVLLAGGYTAELARRVVDEQRRDRDVVVVFGRHFIANPDLPFRIRTGVELTPYKRESFYTPLVLTGYTDYAFSREFLEEDVVA
ncbi:FMN-linked oxidoreductase [Aspergillus heteromorphus CBS 117.55]|uniref:FMN-linked oxidoreductase n=1 Tax=Aspergillus heteromorphus CBS 117.55 TaxID=1448321 RepID=A0A317VBY4_9EURO|nr:FMN-linked oxidoreductase [Aspergillus heteromorphus CBS 117.55]PWY70909.1 FMN-linked oxidoreductase [Aspergillus heteromorphus CBS 117.55]